HQVGQDTGVEAAGAEDDQVGVDDGAEGRLVTRRILGEKENTLDRRFVVTGGGLAADGRAVHELPAKGDIFYGGGEGATADGQDFGGLDHGLIEASGDLREGGDKEVAEGVTGKLRPFLFEAVLKQLVDERFVVSEGGNAVADVTGGRNVELLADTARA